MLILLMLHIINRFRKGSEITIDLNRIRNRLVMGLKYGIPFFLISFTSGDSLTNESETIRFDIVKKEKILGFINMKKIKNAQTTRFIINSEVNTKLLINFKASSKETYIYKEDTLVYSSIYRTLNDKVKVDQSISFTKGNYYLIHNNKKQLMDIDVIKCNLAKLFFSEPVHTKKVYCDKLKIHVNVLRVTPNAYKVVFPNKSYNIYYYQDGKCKLIEAVGTFYKVKLIPKNYRI